MKKKIPENVLKLLNGKEVNEEKILYENDDFLVLVDPKNKNNKIHYTAWIKDDIESMEDLDIIIFCKIIKLKSELIKLNIIDKNIHSFLHYPPSFYRLHIHFCNEEEYLENKNDAYDLNQVLEYIFVSKL